MHDTGTLSKRGRLRFTFVRSTFPAGSFVTTHTPPSPYLHLCASAVVTLQLAAADSRLLCNLLEHWLCILGSRFDFDCSLLASCRLSDV